MTSTEDRVAIVVRIEGRVQGVCFRAWTQSEARALSLDGWVRNRHDGSVEALFAGPAAVVEAMIAACSHGPSAARVTAVRTEPAEPPPTKGFEALPTR